MLNKLINADIRFSYSEYACFPQIPYTQDVLFALQLSEQKDERGYYSPMGAGNWGTYIVNLMLVSAAIGDDVLCMEHYDETEARRIIARAIMDLCPDEAKCLFNGAYLQAKQIHTYGQLLSETKSREETIWLCGHSGECLRCAQRIEDEGIGREVASDVFRPVDTGTSPQTDQCAPPGGTCWVTGLVDCDGAHG